MPTKITSISEGYLATLQRLYECDAAYLGDVDIAGIKWAGGFQDNYKSDSHISAMILLINPKNGAFIAAMDGAYITAIRTEHESAISAKLVRKDASVLGIIGLGSGSNASR
jgi:ornithine cyclodeaminase/alanine dehydrogenase-like protein (mu-crystallin family)